MNCGANMANINNWVRQARHRAIRYKVESTLTADQAKAVLGYYHNKCAYCMTNEYKTMDNPVPLYSGAPNCQANVLPACDMCKRKKHSKSIVWLHESGHISDEKYIQLIREMISREDASGVRSVLKAEIGLL